MMDRTPTLRTEDQAANFQKIVDMGICPYCWRGNTLAVIPTVRWDDKYLFVCDNGCESKFYARWKGHK